MEIQTPLSSSQAGVSQREVAEPTSSAISMTIAPWPIENSAPQKRANGRPARELTRVSPSMVARWSASKPCLRPSRNTSATREVQSAGRAEASIRGLSVSYLWPHRSRSRRRGGPGRS